MSPDQLAEIEGRLKAATPGPWTAEPQPGGPEHTASWGLVLKGPVSRGHDNDLGSMEPGDAIFIAHAPTDIAALLAEVRRLTPAGKVARWGKVKSYPGFDVLKVGRKVWASVDCPNGLWRACITQQRPTFYTKESEARAHIEAWAASKGWEVRDGE